MRQKVGYLESVNAELCEQLERCDVEAMTQQGSLQAEKSELAARMRQLQEEVSRNLACVHQGRLPTACRHRLSSTLSFSPCESCTCKHSAPA